MTKAELRAEYTRRRDAFKAGDFLTNQYALYLDEMLAEYLGVPAAGPVDE